MSTANLLPGGGGFVSPVPVLPKEVINNMKKPKEGTVSLYLRISPSLKAWLQDYADRQDVSMNDVVHAAIEEYLQQNDPQAMRPRGK